MSSMKSGALNRLPATSWNFSSSCGGEAAAAELLHVHPGGAGQQAHEELIRGHLQGEDAHRPFLLERHVYRDVHRERRLPDAGACGEDQELAGMEPGELQVEVDEAGGEPGDAARGHLHPVEQIERALHQLADRPQLALALALRQLEHAALGLVEDGVELPGVLACQLEDLPAHVGQAPPHRLVLDDPRVLDGAGGQGDHLVQRHEVGRAAHAGQLPAGLQLLGEGEVVDRTLLPVQGQHRGEDLGVRGVGEVIGEDDLGHRGHHRVVPQDRAEHRPLGGQILGMWTQRLDDGHRSPLPGAAQDRSAP